jgi:hypothetical protein
MCLLKLVFKKKQDKFCAANWMAQTNNMVQAILLKGGEA